MNPFFNVSTAPVMVNGSELKNQKAIVNSENGNVLGIVSPRYHIIPNQKVAEIFDEALPFGVVSTQDHFYNGGEIWKRRMILDKEEFNFEVLPGDSSGLMIEIFNSYNGKMSYGFSIMGFRWICSNGMIMGKKNIFHASLTHKKESIEVIRSAFNNQLAQANENVKIWQDWTEVGFSLENVETFLNTRKYLNKKNRNRIIDLHNTLLSQERLSQTRWAFYNTLTNFSTHRVESRNKQTSPIFTANYSNATRLIDDFYHYDNSNVIDVTPLN